MKSVFAIAASAACLLLSACASNRPASDARHAIDGGKVATVDQWAEDKHATVMWIHYPERGRE